MAGIFQQRNQHSPGRWVNEQTQQFDQNNVVPFSPVIVGMHHFRMNTALVECRFWGQYRTEYNNILMVNKIILCGDRYLLIDKVENKINWVADKVFNCIKQTQGKVFFVQPTPYLRESLRTLNVYSLNPPMHRGDRGGINNPKVKYTDVTNLKEEGNLTSELDDLKKLTEELIQTNKIRFSPHSGFDLEAEEQVNSLVLIVKEMLTYLLTDTKQLFP